MTDHELEQRLRAGYRDQVDEVAPTSLRANVTAIPDLDTTTATSSLRSGWAFSSIRPFVAFALGGLVVVVVLIAISLIVRPANVGPPSITASPLPSTTESPAAASESAWTATAPMLEGRQGHTATLLADGTVLVAGGSEAATSEVYDPRTGTWTVSGDMTEAREGHTATLLADGTVLVVGGVRPGPDETGVGGNIALDSAELYDPATRSWTATENMVETHGRGHTATLLPNETVLIAGGYPDGRMSASAELFDPATGSWTATSDMLRGRAYHTATLLPAGKVLVAGSLHSDSSAELYDPINDTWSQTGAMIQGRHDFRAILLPDGTVLVTAYEGSNATELYDPSTEAWTETGPMTDVRLGTYWATLLPDGTVLATGGVPNRHAVVERYDPGSGQWVRAADTTDDRHYHTATLLPDGKVLVTGGRGGLGSAELYDPELDS